MKTEKAYIVEDKSIGIYVGHIFWPDDDDRRHTNFYECNNIKAAEHLVIALNPANT